jgi:ABC-type molybdate transport system ATPase subunit
MEVLKATVENAGDKYSLRIKVQSGDVVIPLSDDNANAVKSAFNKLIQRIREGEFKIQLEKEGDDLFSMVAKEYLTQLNKEIREVHSQITEYGLKKPPPSSQ